MNLCLRNLTQPSIPNWNKTLRSAFNFVLFMIEATCLSHPWNWVSVFQTHVLMSVPHCGLAWLRLPPLPGTQPGGFCSSAHSASIFTEREVLPESDVVSSLFTTKKSPFRNLSASKFYMHDLLTQFSFSRSVSLEWKYEFSWKIII